MSPIQGITGVGGAAAPSYVAPKASAVAPPKVEARETAQDERTEAQRGTQEIGERPASNAAVGSRLNTTA